MRERGVIGAGRKLLGEVFYRTNSNGYPFIDSEEEMRAVAALWIAAPDLLEALRLMLSSTMGGKVGGGDGQTYVVHPPSGEAFNKARAAIAKATGDA